MEHRTCKAPRLPLWKRIVAAVVLIPMGIGMAIALLQWLAAGGLTLGLVVAVIAVFQGVACGGCAQMLATIKGYPGTRWFWIGCFFSIFGLVFVCGLPDLDRR